MEPSNLTAEQQLINELTKFANETVCPISWGYGQHGYVSGAQHAWGEARILVRNLLAAHRPSKPSIPHDAVCLFKDGNQWCAVYGDFKNLQESPAGFGANSDEAIAGLHSEAEKLLRAFA